MIFLSENRRPEMPNLELKAPILENFQAKSKFSALIRLPFENLQLCVGILSENFATSCPACFFN